MLSLGLFALETSFLLFCILYFKVQEKKLHQSQVLYQRATVLINARVKHLCITVLLLLELVAKYLLTAVERR